MTMTREEIRRAALAIHELRNFENRSDGQKRRYARGYDTGSDYDPKNRRTLSGGRNGMGGVEPVDRHFEWAERTGRIPKGSWS